MKKNKLNVDDAMVLMGIIAEGDYDPDFLKQLLVKLSDATGDEKKIKHLISKNSVSGDEMIKQSIKLFAEYLMSE